MPPSSVRKRDGSVQPYDRARIVDAVDEAAVATGVDDASLGTRVAQRVEAALGDVDVAAVERIQDNVEASLIALGASGVAKAYIVYRSDRADVRRAAGALGVRDDLKLGLDVVKILEARYLRRDESGRVVETPGELFARVAREVAAAERRFGGDEDARRFEARFRDAMCAREFLPNSPTLMNAGTRMGQLAACFVLPVEDSIDGIFGSLGAMAKIHQSGGGTGFSFSRLRPRGDIVSSTGHVASGPVSFMTIFDATTDVIRQGGRRRGANMGVLRCDHPDILEFIRAKADAASFRNFNISVAVTDAFMEAAAAGAEYDLRNPRTGEPAARANARDVMDLIAASAWESGEPGLLFIDAINRANPTPTIGEIETTNPCGEQPLLSYESCVLGSVNLSACVSRSQGRSGIDYEKLAALVALGVRFLDDCIETSRFPLAEIEEATLANRKVGLGIMGFADLLFELETAYDSDEAVALAEDIMSFVNGKAIATSRDLARERGAFPNYERSVWAGRGEPMRNAAVTSVAPTGTLALIADTSSGIEPRFALVGLRSLLAGSKMLRTVPSFERELAATTDDPEPVLAEVARRGSVRGMDGVDERLRRVFCNAHDVAPEWHVRIQAAFQRHTDSAVSKTINLPTHASPANVKEAYRLAHELGCKGITVYRDGSRPDQVLSVPGGAYAAEDRCGPGRDCAT